MTRSRKIAWALVVVLTVSAVAVGVWFFVRDEYPFQDMGEGDVLALVYETRGENGPVYGFVPDPPADLADWMSLWERDADSEGASTPDTVTVLLRDGRRLRLEVGGPRGYASWISSDGKVGESFGIHFNDAFVWYVRGLFTGLEARPPLPAPTTPGASSPQPTSPVPLSSPTP